MKLSLSLRVILAAVLVAGMAMAADVTGKWTGDVNGPDGGAMQISFTLKQEGAKVTGSVEGPGGNIPIQDGKMDGDILTFTITFDGGGGGMKIAHEAKVNGDEMTLTVKMEGQSGPGSMKLKRVK